MDDRLQVDEWRCLVGGSTDGRHITAGSEEESPRDGWGSEWVEWDIEEGLRGRGGQAGSRKGVGVGPMIDFLCTILGAVRETGGVRRVERPSC